MRVLCRGGSCARALQTCRAAMRRRSMLSWTSTTPCAQRSVATLSLAHAVCMGLVTVILWQVWTNDGDLLQDENQLCALQVAEYHEALKEAMGMGSVAVGVKALHIR